MYVKVVVIIVGSMTEAQFIAHSTLAILNCVYEVMVTKQHQGPEDAALINAPQLFLQLGERQRPLFIGKRLHHKNAVACRLDAMFA